MSEEEYDEVVDLLLNEDRIAKEYFPILCARCRKVMYSNYDLSDELSFQLARMVLHAERRWGKDTPFYVECGECAKKRRR